jgi:phage-related protein
VSAHANVQTAVRGLARLDRAIGGVTQHTSAIGEASVALLGTAASIGKVAAAVPALAVGANVIGGLTAALAQAGLQAGVFGAAFATVGLGIGGFAAAAKPAIADVTNVYKLQTAAIAASAQGGAAATAAQKKYNEALKDLSPQQRSVLTNFNRLNGEYQSWSKGLQSTVLPVFNTWLKAGAGQIQKLTPAVRGAAAALTGLGKSVGTYLKSADFSDTIAVMSAHVQPLLTQLGNTFLNVFKGVMGLIRAFIPYTDQLGGGIENLSAKFATWGQNLHGSSGFVSIMAGSFKQLSTFAKAAANIFAGFGNIIMAFMPQAAGMSGGLLDLTARFRDFTKGLGSSKAFQAFTDYANQNGPLLGKTLGDVALAAIRIVGALSPFGPVVIEIADALAQFINALPMPVLAAIAGAIGTVVLAMKAYALASAAIAAAQWLFTESVTTSTGAVYSSRVAMIASRLATLASAAATGVMTAATWLTSSATWAWTAALLANPITWIVIGILALVAAIVLIATKTTWFQQIWSATWGAIKAVSMAVWNWLKSNWKLVLEILVALVTGPLGLLVTYIATHWDKVKAMAKTAWDAILGVLKNAWNAIYNFVVGIGTSILTAIKTAWNAVWSFVSGKVTAIKNGIVGAFRTIRDTVTSMINRARDAVKAAIGVITSTIGGVKSKVMSAFKGVGSWLYNSGQALIKGFISGIKSMLGSAKNAVSSVVGGVKNFLPNSPAKEGPFSGRGYSLFSGQAIMQDWAAGIRSRADQPRMAINDAAQRMQTATTNSAVWQGVTSRGAVQATNAPQPVYGQLPTLKVESGNAPLDKLIAELIKKYVRVNGQGSVQKAFGQKMATAVNK